MNKLKVADCNGMANVVTGVCIWVMSPILLGKTSGLAAIGCLPWMVCAMPLLLIAVIMLLINGDIVSAMANAVLTGMALFNNIGHALRNFDLLKTGATLPDEATAGIYMMDGMGYLACAIFLLSIVYMSTKANYVQAVFVACPAVAFIALFCGETLGMNVGLIPGIFICIFGCWLIYSGIAMMMHAAAGVQILPYIIGPKH